MILVDSSVWIDWLRAGNHPATLQLDRLIDEDEVVLSPVTEQEILMGARGAAQLAKLRSYFGAIPVLMPTRSTFSDAGALYARCRWAGVTPRSPHDCLIAQSAVEHKIPLLTNDRDFAQIAKIEERLQLLAF
ncbi:PIN domain-containing protein [Acidithiobacillus sp. IBUN Pt1247-S3]|uniref:type II toxin-antitoxin system VapC family toxin n=1 Tax=Acidithiobacillus sp. IBUN Pt1247-S3 TaxID=3166642 RepID=UPI0034E39D9E